MSTRLQFHGLRLAKLLVVNGEGLIQNVCYVIFQSPRQIFVVLFVNAFHVLNGDLLPQHHLVEGTNKEGIQESAMEDGQSNNSANELEVVEMFRVDARMRINL